MKSKIMIRWIVMLFIVLCILMIAPAFYSKNAGAVNGLTSEHKIYDSEGNVATKITMKNGIIQIVTKAHTASTNIKLLRIG